MGEIDDLPFFTATGRFVFGPFAFPVHGWLIGQQQMHAEIAMQTTAILTPFARGAASAVRSDQLPRLLNGRLTCVETDEALPIGPGRQCAERGKDDAHQG